MRNPLLEQVTLRVLSIRKEPIVFWALADSVSFEMQQPELTTNEFRQTLGRLEDKGLIKKEKDALDYTRWSITDLGKSALYV